MASITKAIPSFVADSASNLDLNRPTSMEKFEPLSEQLAREVNSNKVEGKAVIARPIGRIKEKEEEDFYASKKGYSKNDNTSSSQDLYPRICGITSYQ